MAYTSHGHHIPGTIRGEGTVGVVMRCGGIDHCSRCRGEVASRTTKRVPLVDRTGSQPKTIGWAAVDDSGEVVGQIDDPDIIQSLTPDMNMFSIGED